MAIADDPRIDPRIKAVATVSMYDMGGVNRNGLRGAMTLEMRQEALALAAQQRDVEFTGGDVEYVGLRQVRPPEVRFRLPERALAA